MSDSDSEDENIIKYGTALEPYEEDELPSKRKYQQQTDQYAVDAHGRRRFHGAFTGGFSAGFGNTVGTPEGWTPSTFKSSRSEKAQLSSQRAEDFMDEEDRSEFGIAPRHMQTHTEFSGQKRPRPQRYHDGPIPGSPVLEQLVVAAHETAAARILRAMGWRAGQGAGERLRSRDKRRARDQHKVYGCYMPPDLQQKTEENQDSDDSSTSEYDFDTLFAPDDYEPYILHRKNDRFGLGYSGLSRHSVLGTMAGEYGSDAGGSRSHLVMKEKGKKVSIRGQAFGVGAFEADDDDIYVTEDMSHYDFAIGAPADDGLNKKIVNKDRSRNVVPGFVPARTPLPPPAAAPPPALPRDYSPAPRGRRTRFAPTAAPPRDQGLGRHELTATARGALLGETPVPKTVAQTSTQANTAADTPPPADPIAKVLGRNITFQSDNTLNYIPITESGKKITNVFKPFVGNPQKQARYEKYLQDKNSVLERDGDTDKLCEWERERELVEFEQAAKLYRPLTGEMGDRFTHPTQPDDGALNPLSAVAKSSTSHGSATIEQIQAAEKGVYGVMTRREAAWRPEGLVCKRFNIPDPGGTRVEQQKEDKPKVSYSVFSYLESSVHDKDSFAKEQGKFSGSKSLNRDTCTKPKDLNSIKSDQNLTKTTQVTTETDQISNNSDQNSAKSNQTITIDSTSAGFNKRMTVAELFLKESEKTKEHGNEVTETINQFDKMDLYKAIFLSDSEDETDVTSKNDEHNFTDVPKNLERNTSPPRGIFANIDFDELNSWKRDNKTETSNKTNEKHDNVPKSSEDKDKNGATDREEGVYGPKIPDFLQKRLESNVDKVQSIEIKSSSDDSWVDVNELKNKKRKKKSKKHKSKAIKKSHKKKSKSKKKDK